MGYYTDYSLIVEHTSNPDEDIPEALIQTLTSELYFEDEWSDTRTYFKNDTWCNHKDHMLALSKLWPDYTFKLTGAGETPEDLWTYYFRNGKSQGGMAEIIYPELSEEGWK